MNMEAFQNPFRPGAGHKPPYLAGRKKEEAEFRRLLKQTDILENMILTGLRGVGKTVLLEQFKPMAISENWLWVGTDLSESSSISEENLATRILADLSVVSSSIVLSSEDRAPMGFTGEAEKVDTVIGYDVLKHVFSATPGLVSDKLKAALEFVWAKLPKNGRRGIIFAYDEAQNLSDHASKEQYPTSLLLDVFQSIQRKGVPFMLVLAGLPTLFPKLVEARTFAERMFHVVFLNRLSPEDSRDAIKKPIETADCPVRFSDESVDAICLMSNGYPYFIQFISRETYDIWTVNPNATIPVSEIIGKLDADFFAGRWARATDRQRELLIVIANLDSCDDEFTVQEIAEKSVDVGRKAFKNSHINQMLASLIKAGLVYKNRHGKYSLAVPLLGDFIKRQIALNME